MKRAGASGGLELTVLGLSALGLLVGSGATRSAASAPPPAAPTGAHAASGSGLYGPSAVAGPMPPLPGGAPLRALDDLPTEQPGDTGCRFSDRGFGDYGHWRPLPLGKVLVPEGRGVAADGAFRLLIHFHGAEPVRKQLAPEGLDLVIAALDAGTGSHAYARALEGGEAFAELVASIEREVAVAQGLPAAHAHPIVVSSWSAGSGAVARVLEGPHERLAGLVLLDSLYASYPASGRRALEHGQLPQFLGAARAAQQGGPLFYLTHTEVPTPDYASSEEVASYLLWELGAQASFVTAGDGAHPAGAGTGDASPLLRTFEDGHLVVHGYAGAGADAHCGQLRLLPAILREHVLPLAR